MSALLRSCRCNCFYFDIKYQFIIECNMLYILFCPFVRNINIIF